MLITITQQRDSVTHSERMYICIHILECMYIYIIFHIIFHDGLAQDMEKAPCAI